MSDCLSTFDDGRFEAICKKDDIGLSIWQKSLRKIMTERSKCVIIPSLTVEAIKKPAKGWNLNP